MKSTLSKVLAIVAASLVVIVAILAIVLSFVQTNFNQVINTNKLDGVTVYLGNNYNYYSSNSQSEEDKEVFNKFKELYNVGTKESVLSALFQGAYSKEAEAQVLKNTVSETTIKTSEENIIKVKLHFSENMDLVVNGEEVKDKTTNQTIYYDTVYLNVENNSTLTKVTCYVMSTANESWSYVQTSYVTHHSELYNYLNSLEFPG